MGDLAHLVAEPSAWAAFSTLVALELVLGVDNLIFVAILSNRLPEGRRTPTRTLGLGLALLLRLGLLSAIAWIARLTTPVFDLGLTGPVEHGRPTFETAFSWRDLILIAGGVFLIWKASGELRDAVIPRRRAKPAGARGQLGFASALVQIIALDLVFSFDSILTAVGMTDRLPIMMAAVVVAVMLMLVASGPLAAFVRRNPTFVILALAFLLMIGMTLIADGFGFHVPRGYIYAAMAFSTAVELLNMAARRKTRRDSLSPGGEELDADDHIPAS